MFVAEFELVRLEEKKIHKKITEAVFKAEPKKQKWNTTKNDHF